MNNYIIPASIVEENQDDPIKDNNFIGESSINMDFFDGSNEFFNGEVQPETITEKKKRGRPAGSKNKEPKTKTTSAGDVIVVPEDNTSENLPMLYSNESFADGYKLGTGILKQTVTQLDEIGFEVMQEFNKVKNSQMKSKYVVLPQLASTLSTIIGTKVTAVREMNKTVKDCYDLEMKRAKENKDTMSQVSDEQYVMDAYNAFISAPVGAQPFIAPPSMVNSITMSPNDGIVRANIGNVDDAYQNYVSNITPEQNRMNCEHNKNIQTVVVYDASNPLNRYFDVIDVTTGQSVPNYPRPDKMFMENITIDEYNNIARDSNLDINYPLVVINKENKMAGY